MRKSVSILLILAMVLMLSVGTSYAATGAEPGTRITRVGLAVGLYGSKYRERHSEQAAESAESGESAAQISTASELPANSENAVEALVQSYKAEDGIFELSDESRFYIASGNRPNDDMIGTVRLMAAQFASMKLPTETALPVIYGEKEYIRDGDIVLKIVSEADFFPGCDTADITEAYRLEIGEVAEITACGMDGLYYGLITLMEMAAEKTDGDNKIAMNRCTISDGPDVKERTLLLDCARKYFSKEWIENLIKRASLQRYNAIELHFTEAQGIRFDSVVFPWLTEGIDSLSREDMADIIDTAKAYHMEVIPSIDVPGHNQYMVEKYASHVNNNPDWFFTYDGKKYDSNTKGFSSIANHYSYNGETKDATYIGIDVTNEHAVAFMDALIDDYADFFKMHGCTKFNIGGDELMGWYNLTLGDKSFTYDNRWEAIEHWGKYAQEKLGIENGSASDTFVNYINTVSQRLEKQGYTCRVFNDEININDDQHIKLREEVEIVMWSKQAGNYTSITDAGHNIYINPENFCYYVVSNAGGGDIMKGKYKSVNSKNIYENWNPISFITKSGYHKTPATDQMAGAYFDIWCDFPDYKDATTIWNETDIRTWANASKMWNSEISTNESGINSALPYTSFKTFTKKMGGFPGYFGDPNQKTKLASVGQLIDGNSVLSRWFG